MYQQQGYEHQYDQAAGDLTYAYLRRILGDVETADDAGCRACLW